MEISGNSAPFHVHLVQDTEIQLADEQLKWEKAGKALWMRRENFPFFSATRKAQKIQKILNISSVVIVSNFYRKGENFLARRIKYDSIASYNFSIPTILIYDAINIFEVRKKCIYRVFWSEDEVLLSSS